MTMRYFRPGEPPTIWSGEFRNVRKFKNLKVALKDDWQQLLPDALEE